jgi:hypothetical protein
MNRFHGSERTVGQFREDVQARIDVLPDKTEAEPIVIKTQHGFQVSYLRDDKCNIQDFVQFYYNSKFRFAIPMSDLMDIVDGFKKELKP